MAKRVITTRLVKRGEEEAFDREFWRNAGHEARWAAAWEMVVEADLFRGKNASQPRLQRTVLRIQRRER